MSRYSPWAKTLGFAFVVLWLLLAIKPLYRHDWLLENALVVIGVPLLVWYGPGLRFSNATYSCLFVFFVLHIVGAHYTYAEVPYGKWLGFEHGRNHFDRFVHFAYGLLLAKPTLDLFAARAPAAGIWAWLMPVFFLASHGGIYEVVEWQAAEIFGGDLGEAYLGTQGDSWDAQKDMGLAAIGAALGVTAWQLRSSRA
jgi:putative membrane protein